jgi:predicted Zn-dependent protease
VITALAVVGVLGGIYWAFTRSGWDPLGLTDGQGADAVEAGSPERPWPAHTTERIRNRLARMRFAIAYLRAAAERERERTAGARALLLEAREVRSTDDARAEELLRQAISETPDFAPALSALADLRLDEDPDEARELGLRCLALDDGDPVCHRTVVSTFTRRGEFDEAFPHIAYCLEMDPRNVDCASAMTSYYLSRGKLDEARNMVNWLKWSAPDSVFTHTAAGDLAHRCGDAARAREAFQKACDMGQEHACTMLDER